MRRKIFLITNAYPYGVGEQFIEAEAKYWPAELVVVPMDVSGGQTRKVDAAVETRLAVASDRNVRLVDLGRLLLTTEFWRELIVSPKIIFSMSALRQLIIFLILSNRLAVAWRKNGFHRCGADVVVYTYWFSWATHCFSRLKKNRLLGCKLVSRAHRVDVYKYALPHEYMPLRKSYADYVEKIFTISEDARSYLNKEYGISEEKLEVARLGTAVPSVLAKRSEDSRIRVVSVSYIKPVKRLDRMLDLVEDLAQRGWDVSWTHFGDGPGAKELKGQAAQREINVRWMGQVSNKAVLDYYEKNPVDLFVNLSDSEGIPVSIMEALAYGIPVVATAVGGTPEIVSMAVGTLVRPEEPRVRVADLVEVELRRKRLPEEIAQYQQTYYSTGNFSRFIEKLQLL